MKRVQSDRRAARIVAGVVFCLCALAAAGARAQKASPFQPAGPPKAKILRLLAPNGTIDPSLLDDFERSSGWAVAYDAYDAGDSVAERWREGPYDLVVLAGPDLQRRIAAGALAKIDRVKVPNSRVVHPAVATKLSGYDSGAAFGVVFGWSAFGLLYDAEKATARLGGAPVSWGQLLLPRESARLAECGTALPNARDEVFASAWRLMNIDPARATPSDVKTAGALIEKIRPTLAAFAIVDVAGALARGAVCLSAGPESAARAATARTRAGGPKASFRFAYPREGGVVSIEAFALPKDAPHAETSLMLLDFLMKPENLARGTKLAGLVSAREAGPPDVMKRMSPEPVFDDKMNAALEAEWKRLRSVK